MTIAICRPSLQQLLLERWKSLEAGVPRKHDPYHLSLVIESGGNRAASAGGMVSALHDFGMEKCFDSIHGSSAGACTAAYFAAGQTHLGYDIFVNLLTSSDVVKWRTFFGSPSIIDSDYIVDVIFKRRAKLDVGKILESPLKLSISTTDVATGMPTILSAFQNTDDILEALRATLRVPSVTERGVAIAGRPQLDGGISAPLAINSAATSGATHTLILGTQRLSDYLRKTSLSHLAETIYLRIAAGAPVARAYSSNGRHEIVARIASGLAPELGIIAREDSGQDCSVFETDRRKVARTWEEGYEAAGHYIKGLSR